MTFILMRRASTQIESHVKEDEEEEEEEEEEERGCACKVQHWGRGVKKTN